MGTMMVAGSLYGPAPAGPMPRTRTQIRAPEVKPRSAHFDLVTLGCGVHGPTLGSLFSGLSTVCTS